MDMMYMPDAINAAISLMEADPARLLKHRNAFNIASMSFDPEMICGYQETCARLRNDLSDRSFEAGHCRQLARFAG